MSKFSYFKTIIKDLIVLERHPIEDSRGTFERLFCIDDLKIIGWDRPIAQINHSITKKKGTVRGLHFQKQPFTEMKLVSCLEGEVWDVAVDLRINSPSFLKWHAEILSEKNSRALFIPKGFAHGFQTLSDNCKLLYLHSVPYTSEAEVGMNVNDPLLNISWPLKITEISLKDSEYNLLDLNYMGVSL